MKALLTHSCGN